MQKKTILVLLFAMLIALCGTIPVQATTISFIVSDSYITTGESFDIDVFAQEDESAGDLWLFGFDVGSLSLSSYDGYAVDSAWRDEGDSSNYVAGSWDDTTVGNAGTNILLATLSFTAGGTSGTETLFIEGIGTAPNWDRGAYYSDVYPPFDISGELSITIHDTPVPEPGTLLLFGAGLLGLAGFRRRLTP